MGCFYYVSGFSGFIWVWVLFGSGLFSGFIGYFLFWSWGLFGGGLVGNILECDFLVVIIVRLVVLPVEDVID